MREKFKYPNRKHKYDPRFQRQPLILWCIYTFFPSVNIILLCYAFIQKIKSFFSSANYVIDCPYIF